MMNEMRGKKTQNSEKRIEIYAMTFFRQSILVKVKIKIKIKPMFEHDFSFLLSFSNRT